LDVAVGGQQAKTPLLQHTAVLTSGNQRHVAALLEQPRADGSADTARAVEDEPHAPCLELPFV
jgi:hypothetical protein